MSENNTNQSGMKNLWKPIIVSVAVIISAIVLSMAYSERHKPVPGTISVTGLGEMEFTSDMIVVQGEISVRNVDAAAGYRELMSQREELIKFLEENGVNGENVSFGMPSTYENTVGVWNEQGDYMGTRFVDYTVSSSFVIESANIDDVEGVAQKLPSLIEESIDIAVYEPLYYYTELDSLKLDLIAEASADALARAKEIAASSDAKIDGLKSSRAGVFQITSVSGNEEFSAGGIYNLTSREKKARVTVHSVFQIK